MPRYKAAFEDGAIELPRDAEILADHRALVMENGIAKPSERRNRDAAGNPRHADSAIAGALAYYASRLPPREYGYQPARPPRLFGALGAPERELKDYADENRGSRIMRRARGWLGV
jgi:hypothetical protein